jgi:hypothetical protein
VRRVGNSRPRASGLSKTKGIAKGLRREVRDAFNSVSSLLGGSREGEGGNLDTVSRTRTVNTMLDFAEAS